MVLASHAQYLGATRYTGVAKLAPRLGVGVWIFFAASGYLIAGPFLKALLEGRPTPPVRGYALRRAVRIFPAYWVALAAILLLAVGSTLAHWWQLPVHALLMQGLVPGELKNMFLVAWSLGVEVIFYVLVPLGAWAVRRVAGDGPIPLHKLVVGVLVLWCTAVTVSVAVAMAFPQHAGRALPGGVQVLDLVGSLANFCPGMLVFLALLGREAANSRWRRGYAAVASLRLPALIIAAALFLAATELKSETNHLAAAVQGPLLGIASGIVLATCLNGSWPRRAVAVLAPIGLISYGVYLWHWAILLVLVHHGVTMGPGSGSAATIVRIVTLLSLSLPVALLSWLFIERPLLRRTTGWERRTKTSAPRRRRDEPHDARVPGAPAPDPLPASPQP